MNYQIIINNKAGSIRLETHIPTQDAGYWQKQSV